MKRNLILSLIACGASLALTPGLMAQDASPAPAAPSAAATTGSDAGGGARGGRRGGFGNPDAMLARLTTALTLTADQQAQIKPILATEASSIQSIRADTTLAQADKRAKMTDARTTANTAISALLTDDQKTKFTAMQAKMGGRRRGGGGGAGGGAGGGGGGGGGN